MATKSPRAMPSRCSSRRAAPRRPTTAATSRQVPMLETTATGASMRLAVGGADERHPAARPGHRRAERRTRNGVEVDRAGGVRRLRRHGAGVPARRLRRARRERQDRRDPRQRAARTLPSEPRAHYASSELKQRNAADHGAVALVTLLGPDDVKRYPWERITTYASRPTHDVDAPGRLARADRAAPAGSGVPEPGGIGAAVRRSAADLRGSGREGPHGRGRRRRARGDAVDRRRRPRTAARRARTSWRS